jgi:hypothetical protein
MAWHHYMSDKDRRRKARREAREAKLREQEARGQARERKRVAREARAMERQVGATRPCPECGGTQRFSRLSAVSEATQRYGWTCIGCLTRRFQANPPAGDDDAGPTEATWHWSKQLGRVVSIPSDVQ